MIVAGLIDQLYLWNANLLVNARALLRGGLHGSHGTTNGYALLLLLRLACRGRPAKDQYKLSISQRLIGPIVDEFCVHKKSTRQCRTGNTVAGWLRRGTT